jgi:hypothetical protein
MYRTASTTMARHSARKTRPGRAPLRPPTSLPSHAPMPPRRHGLKAVAGAADGWLAVTGQGLVAACCKGFGARCIVDFECCSECCNNRGTCACPSEDVVKALDAGCLVFEPEWRLRPWCDWAPIPHASGAVATE